jgi:4-diphosphocytidyl-2-C-methyl-D-erythritol kinase
MSQQSDRHMLRTIAPAKVNLTFEVLGKRSDGYHEVRTVMQTVALADELAATPAAESSLHITGFEAEALTSPENLVSRAEAAVPAPLRASPLGFSLAKRVPAAAGLGGGSSDAAAALRLMQRLWALPDEVVHDVAAALGSDISFFLRGGTQLAAGRGEIVMPLPDIRPCALLIATPPIALPNKTAQLYARLTPDDFTDGAATDRLVRRIRSGQPFRGDDFVNAFDAVADTVFPGLAGFRERFSAITGERPMLAGAGPSLFAVVPPAVDDVEVAAWREALGRFGFLTAWTHTIGADEATAIT